MFDRSRIIYVALRVITSGIWAALWMSSPFFRYSDLGQPLQFVVMTLFAFALGYIHTVPHPRASRKATIYASLYWSLLQTIVTFVVYAIGLCIIGGWHLSLAVRLSAMADSLQWILLMLFFKPLFLGAVWALAFLNQLVLCTALSRMNP